MSLSMWSSFSQTSLRCSSLPCRKKGFYDNHRGNVDQAYKKYELTGWWSFSCLRCLFLDSSNFSSSSWRCFLFLIDWSFFRFFSSFAISYLKWGHCLAHEHEKQQHLQTHAFRCPWNWKIKFFFPVFSSLNCLHDLDYVCNCVTLS